jgi:hypothetical protein
MFYKNIKFIPSHYLKNSGQQIIEPIPAKKQIPQWYKESELKFNHENEQNISGLKTCMPFLDSMISGYFILLQNNVYVEKKNNEIKVSWEGNIDLISERPKELGKKIPRPENFLNNHMTWFGLWGAKLPKKYSLLMTHPLNREDLPFRTVSAIVDYDKMMAWGNIPFFINKDFEGLIPKGTPICHVIPFKREKWAMSVDSSWTKNAHNQGTMCRSVTKGYYRDKFWSKKEYS